MESYIHLYKTNSEFTAAYNGPDYKEPWLSLTEENMTIGYSKPKLIAIAFGTITWVTDVPATGGTATKDNCSFKVYGNYDNGTSVDISSIVTVEGELVVPSSTATTRHEVGQLTLTASYSGFTATGNVTVYQAAVDFSAEPLTFNILSAGTINWRASNSAVTKTIDYKLNNNEWTPITSNTGETAPKINVAEGDKIQFRGNNEQYATNFSYYNSFSGSTALFEAEGNIMSLIYGDDFKNNLIISSTYAFYNLFKGCVNLVSAENLVLPATTLANSCYHSMFFGCTSLTTAPELPATKLANSCYYAMFYGTNVLPDCSNIDFASSTVVASGGLQGLFVGTKVTDNDLERLLPKNDNGKYYLPATTLAYGCYESMFNGCKSLTTAPALPATTLANGCYSSMFDGCTSLTTAPELPATTLARGCYYYMFGGCTSLTTAPVLPVTDLAPGCYESMFYKCTSLTTAPALPATTLAEGCYGYMFNGCTSLNYIKCLATNISAPNCTYNWVSGVASTGTFVKASSMTSWKTGTNGIPTGWAKQNA